MSDPLVVALFNAVSTPPAPGGVETVVDVTSLSRLLVAVRAEVQRRREDAVQRGETADDDLSRALASAAADPPRARPGLRLLDPEDSPR